MTPCVFCTDPTTMKLAAPWYYFKGVPFTEDSLSAHSVQKPQRKAQILEQKEDSVDTEIS